MFEVVSRKIDVFQNLELFKVIVLNSWNETLAENQIFECSSHVWKVIDLVIHVNKIVPSQIESLNPGTDSKIDANRDVPEDVAAQTKAGKLFTWYLQQGKT